MDRPAFLHSGLRSYTQAPKDRPGRMLPPTLRPRARLGGDVCSVSMCLCVSVSVCRCVCVSLCVSLCLLVGGEAGAAYSNSRRAPRERTPWIILHWPYPPGHRPALLAPGWTQGGPQEITFVDCFPTLVAENKTPGGFGHGGSPPHGPGAGKCNFRKVWGQEWLGRGPGWYPIQPARSAVLIWSRGLGGGKSIGYPNSDPQMAMAPYHRACTTSRVQPQGSPLRKSNSSA